MLSAFATKDNMTTSLIFNRAYLAFSTQAEPYQRADDVGFAITEFMWFHGKPFYPIGALAGAQVARVCLSEGDFDVLDDDNIDLVFRMREAEGDSFFELVLRSDRGTAYGGWLWGRDVRVLDEFVDDRRVLATSVSEGDARFEYNKAAGRYRCVNRLPVEKAAYLNARD